MQVWIPTPQGWYAGVRAGFAVDWALPHASNMGFAWCIPQAAPQTSNLLVLLVQWCNRVQLQDWNSNELGFKSSFGRFFSERVRQWPIRPVAALQRCSGCLAG